MNSLTAAVKQAPNDACSALRQVLMPRGKRRRPAPPVSGIRDVEITDVPRSEQMVINSVRPQKNLFT
jgi:hypothetical protein